MLGSCQNYIRYGKEMEKGKEKRRKCKVVFFLF
jgi:hypothetical protein